MKRGPMLAAAAALLILGGCSANRAAYSLVDRAPQVAAITAAQRDLLRLPAPTTRLTVAVYNFQDQTGQFRSSEGTQTLSRVVSQGGTSILVKALQDAGNRGWFQVMERERLDNLLKERQIIREMRQRYLGEEQVNPEALPSLMFAGILLEGGVIGYDANTLSGGAGARYLGIGAHSEYRQDTVTVYLRAVSVKTGEVLTTVVARKTVASVALSASAFKFVAYRELLEAETGVSTNEPDQIALQQAIEKAVHSLVLEGAHLGYWRFADPAAATPLIEEYLKAKRGIYEADAVPQQVAQAPRVSPRRMASARREEGAQSTERPARDTLAAVNTGARSTDGRAAAPAIVAPQAQ
ncbi:MAG: CsgG/HfaB family protein [Hyphomonadaceae bacterium]|nr:CsgG/HfaB family protein [Hyphomonadaceae bacterium]